MNIVLKGKDGSVAIMVLAPGADEADAIKKFHGCHPGMYHKEYVKDVNVPSDRQYRDAWTLNGNSVQVDPIKAKDIHLERVRHARDKKLEELDKDHLRYLSDPAKLKDVEEKKQILRDLPKNVKGLEWPTLLEK